MSLEAMRLSNETLHSGLKGKTTCRCHQVIGILLHFRLLNGLSCISCKRAILSIVSSVAFSAAQCSTATPDSIWPVQPSGCIPGEMLLIGYFCHCDVWTFQDNFDSFNVPTQSITMDCELYRCATFKVFDWKCVVVLAAPCSTGAARPVQLSTSFRGEMLFNSCLCHRLCFFFHISESLIRLSLTSRVSCVLFSAAKCSPHAANLQPEKPSIYWGGKLLF